ncbi:MAG TPA: alcohol dehydrogenase catalytic domain-containing protein [Pseudonocardiaceae bacterium]|nr:alcohol dehydrogenase catalytic domain-containing protein [Pseudonocardiaceae bacterium]
MPGRRRTHPSPPSGLRSRACTARARRPPPASNAIIPLPAPCICGSDLWPYRGVDDDEPTPTGHEYVGIVERVANAVSAPVPARTDRPDLAPPDRPRQVFRPHPPARRTSSSGVPDCRSAGWFWGQ